MTTRLRQDSIAAILAASFALQGVGLVIAWPPPPRVALQIAVVSVMIALAVNELWRQRTRLNHRADMLIVMLGLGGLGMLIGEFIDMKLGIGGGGGHGNLSPASLIRPVFTWMTALMLVGGIPPSLAWTRCARLARQNGRRWFATHIVGNLGMIFGMILIARLWGHPLGMMIHSMRAGHHLAMLLGMAGGMLAAQIAAEALLGLHPFRRVVVELPAASGRM